MSDSPIDSKCPSHGIKYPPKSGFSDTTFQASHLRCYSPYLCISGPHSDRASRIDVSTQVPFNGPADDLGSTDVSLRSLLSVLSILKLPQQPRDQ